MKKLLTILLLIPFLSHATNYYFSSRSGDDSRIALLAKNPATPWASVSKLNTIFNTLLPGDSILFKRGESFYGTIIISKSGTSILPIIIGAYGVGSKPEITSLIPLTWLNAGVNLWRSVEAIAVPYMNLVLKNNLPIAMGRWPNLGDKDGGYNTMVTSTSNTITDAAGLTTSPAKNKPAYLVGAEVHYRSHRFLSESEIIKSVSGSTITFDPTQKDPPGKGMGYFIQNDSTTLDLTSEWWYNPKNNKLKYFNEAQAPTGIEAASLDNIVISAGKNYITFDGINFNGCNKDIFNISGSFITVQNCMLQNGGRDGIRYGVSYMSVTNSSVINCLSKGLNLIDGADHAMITGNYIYSIGQLIGHNNGAHEDGFSNHSGVAIYVTGSADHCTIRYNYIGLTGHNGIHWKRQDFLTIEYNRIDSTDNVNDDGGGLYGYTGDNLETNHTVIRYNIISNGIGAPHGAGTSLVSGQGVAGIYLDEGTSNVDGQHNTIFNYFQGIFQNWGSNNNIITNNTIYNCNFDLQVNTHASPNPTRNLRITNNICIATLITQVNISLDNSSKTKPEANLNLLGVIDSNLYYRPLSVPPPTSLRWITSKINNITLFQWKTKFPYDGISTASPYFYASKSVQDTSVILKYNASMAPLAVQLYKKYVNAKGVKFETGSIVLKAFTSEVLFRTGELDSAKAEPPIVIPPVIPPVVPPVIQPIAPNNRVYDLNNWHVGFLSLIKL